MRRELLCLMSAICALATVFKGETSVNAQDLTVVAKGKKGKIVQVLVRSGGKESLGSGFWINEDGYVATCFHVVASDTSVTIQIRSAVDSMVDLKNSNITIGNWEVFNATVVDKDIVNDIAILKIDPNPFKVPRRPGIAFGDTVLSAHYERAELEIGLPLPGERVLIAGYPLGLPYLVFQEATVASIAVLGAPPNLTPKILLSAVANHGNSGGPVFDDRGRVIGLLEGEIPDQDKQRTGLEIVVPAFFLAKLMRGIQQPH
jgi:serine protease Do